ADRGDQHNKHHRTNPSAAPETLASRRPTPRYRHIVRTANRQLRPAFRNSALRLQIPVADDHAAIQVSFSPQPVILPPTNYCPFVALHQGFKATIPNYLEMELRYM